MDNENKIVKVKKNTDGAVTEVMFKNGDIYPLNHAILMAKQGLVEGFNVVRGKNGGEYLMADSNSPEINEIDDMPQFK